MNYPLIASYLGRFALLLSASFLPSLGWSLWYAEWPTAGAFVASAAVAAILGLALWLPTRRADQTMYERETLSLLVLGWLTCASVGALPFVFTDTLGVVDAFFESTSGFTTTGSTVLPDIEAAPKGLLFWRSFTHWIGGMGIVVMFLVVLPYLRAGGKQLLQRELTGPTSQGLRPRVRYIWRRLFTLYASLTGIQTLLMMLLGMNLFDALCHTFGTIASGGYSNKQASVAAFDSLPIELVTVFFMLLAGTNFSLIFLAHEGRFKEVWRNTEWRAYMLIWSAAVLLIALNLTGVQRATPFEELREWNAPHLTDYSLGHALRASVFNVTSIMTTTGFSTEDFDQWPYLSKMLLLGLMVIGGSAGSTAGGLKVARIVMLAKMVKAGVDRTFRPRTVYALRMSGEVIDAGVQHAVFTFFTLYVLLFAFATVVLAGLGLPPLTAVSSVAATINGVGPGLEYAGASEDFHLFPTSAKLLLCTCMIMGRLELLSVCALFMPSFWRRNS